MGRLSRFLLTLLVAVAAPAVALAQSVEPVRPGDRTLGSADAPVTLTVYLSTTCSHCAEWHTRDFPGFKARWVDTGKVRVAFRDLPTPPADLAIAGAVMARCAPEDRFDEVLEALFEGQAQLRASSAVAPRQAAINWLRAGGQAGGLTAEQMNACISNDAAHAEIEARAAQADADGVTGTPTFLINGEKVPHEALPHPDAAAFEPLIQPLLDGR